MEVNKIIKTSATMLQLHDIEQILKTCDNIQVVKNNDMQLLLDCVNIVCNTIATDYLPIVETKIINNENEIILWNELTNKQVYKILSVKDNFGCKVKFKITANGVECPNGLKSIMYSYFPDDYNYNESIDIFKESMTIRVFAMGVVAEYLFIKGNSDDAVVWEDRFKNAMKSILRNCREIVLPKRRWW